MLIHSGQITVAIITVALLLQSGSLYGQEEKSSVSAVSKSDTQSQSEIKPVRVAESVSAKPAKPKPKFKVIHKRDGIMVGSRPWGNSEYPEYLVQAVVKTSIDRLWEVISDVESYPEFMPYVVQAKVMKDKDGGLHVYQLIDPPIGASRDFTMKVKIVKKDNEYIREFCSCAEMCPATKDRVIRVTCCDGSWTFKKLDEERSLVKYQLHTEPGGSMPAWITRKANKTSLPGVVDAVRRRALDKSWSKVAKD